MARHRRTIKKKMPAKDKSLTAEKNIADYIEKEREGVKARKNRGLFKKYPPRNVCATMMMCNTDWMERIRLLSPSRKDCESPGGSALNNDSFVAMELPLPTDATITTTRQQRQHRHYHRRNRRRRHRYHHRLSCSHHHQRIMRRWPEGATTREREREVAARSLFQQRARNTPTLAGLGYPSRNRRRSYRSIQGANNVCYKHNICAAAAATAEESRED